MYIPCIETRCFKPLMSRISCVRTAFLSSLLSAIRKSIVSFVGVFGNGVKTSSEKSEKDVQKKKKKKEKTHRIMAHGKKTSFIQYYSRCTICKIQTWEETFSFFFLIKLYLQKKRKKKKKTKIKRMLIRVYISRGLYTKN